MTIFSKIAAGEIPSYKCAENDQFYAFLDIDPVTKGHTLVIPRKEVDYIFDMEDEELAQVVLGLEVNHAHIHLLPMNSEVDVNFKHHVQVEAEEQKEIAAKIFKTFQELE